jgi:hypothetical protein
MKPRAAQKGSWPKGSSATATGRVRSAKLDLASVEIVKAGELVPVPLPARKLIEPSAFAAYDGHGSIAQIISGAVEIAKRRGFLFLTHREIGAALEGTSMLAYSLALAIAVAAGPARAQSLSATVIQTTGAMVVLRRPAAYAPAMVRDAHAVIVTMLEL